MAEAAGVNPVTGARAWSVAALLLAVSDALQARLGAVTVRGELSGFSRAGSGHCYFTLKDSDGQAASLRCAMFRRAASLLDFTPADGQQVELRGRIAVYEARGELQCVVESMQRLGAGSLYELFLRLRARLELAGLFEASRKRPIPGHPTAIGVITSASGAALHDVVTTIARRAPQVRVVIYPSLVQGADAPAQLVRALQLAASRNEVDTLIVCRGGGSLEDLWSFNDEQVVRAVAASALPVVCAVGHETDVTLAELAADLRAATPTAAAELTTPLRSEALTGLASVAQRLQRALRRRLDSQAQRLDRLALQMGRPARAVALQTGLLERMALRHRLATVQLLRQRALVVDRIAQRLSTALHQQQAQQRSQLEQRATRLQACDPRQVLGRGYAWLSDSQGRAVTRAAGLQAGAVLGAQWVDGSATVEVRSVSVDEAAR
jgi:exodeoxyribonuclease VII large subunit